MARSAMNSITRRIRNHVIPATLMALSLVVLVYILNYVNYDITVGIGASAIIFASFAGSAFLLFMVPRSRTASIPRFAKSYAISCVLGVIGYYVVGIAGIYATVALILFATAMLLVITDSEHPPAMSIAFAFVLFRVSYVGIITVVVAAAVMIAIRVFLEKAVYIIEEDIERVGSARNRRPAGRR